MTSHSQTNGVPLDAKRICVIGAGTAGLCALKNSLEYGFQAVAYESSSEVGGTWVYSDKVEADREDEVQSSMYEGLCTNLPKEIMGYPDYPYPKDIKESFISWSLVLQYLNSYTDHFQLRDHIKFRHAVIRVRPAWRKKGWEVLVRNMDTNEYKVEHFDFMFVCNGHYTTPMYPRIPDMDVYQGKIMHSHLFRKASVFQDEIVLIIGGGPSGVDITNNVRVAATQVILSHHLETPPNTSFMDNVIQRPDVKHFTKSGVVFKDGTSAMVDHVIICTGFEYTFPFLSVDCDIQVEDNHVQPLYKHIISIKHPTMAFIGLIFQVLPSQSFDLQSRFVLKYFTGQRDLPSEEEMMEDRAVDIKERQMAGLGNRRAHMMGTRQYDYYKTLSDMAGIKNVTPVVCKIMKDCARKYIYELDTYRSTCYRLLDEENFEKYKI